MNRNNQFIVQNIDCPVNPIKPTCNHKLGLYKRIRKRTGSFLEYAWHLSNSIRSPAVDVLIVAGNELHTGHSIKTLYIGNCENYKFIFSRLCSEHEIIKQHRKVNSFSIKKWIEGYESLVDMICLDLELLYCRILDDGRYIKVPHWVRQKYHVPDTWQKVLQSFRKNTRKSDLRKVRKYNLSFRITKTDEEFRDFYQNMHRPYLEKRFDEVAIIEPEGKFLRQCRKGELMQVVRDDKVVAAVLLHNSEGRLAYVWVGVPADIDGEMFKGAFSGLYYFTILYGYNMGCHEIDFLGTRPLINDGLFRYKRKWGTYVEDSPIPRGDIFLKPLNFNDSVKSFFENNYFVIRDGANLAGKILFQKHQVGAEDLNFMIDQYFCRGLSCLKIFSMRGFDDKVSGRMEKYNDVIKLYDLSKSRNPAADFISR